MVFRQNSVKSQQMRHFGKKVSNSTKFEIYPIRENA